MVTQALQQDLETFRKQIHQLTGRVHEVDPYLILSPETLGQNSHGVTCGVPEKEAVSPTKVFGTEGLSDGRKRQKTLSKLQSRTSSSEKASAFLATAGEKPSYADIAAGRTSPCIFQDPDDVDDVPTFTMSKDVSSSVSEKDVEIKLVSPEADNKLSVSVNVLESTEEAQAEAAFSHAEVSLALKSLEKESKSQSSQHEQRDKQELGEPKKVVRRGRSPMRRQLQKKAEKSTKAQVITSQSPALSESSLKMENSHSATTISRGDREVKYDEPVTSSKLFSKEGHVQDPMLIATRVADEGKSQSPSFGKKPDIEVFYAEENITERHSKNTSSRNINKKSQQIVPPQKQQMSSTMSVPVGRGRSPSPMWIPGSDQPSYADILRGRQASQTRLADCSSEPEVINLQASQTAMPKEAENKLINEQASQEITLMEPEIMPSDVSSYDISMSTSENVEPIEEKGALSASEFIESADLTPVEANMTEKLELKSKQSFSKKLEVTSPEFIPNVDHSNVTFTALSNCSEATMHHVPGVPPVSSQVMFEFIQPSHPDLVGFVASGQQLIYSGLGTYTASNQYDGENAHESGVYCDPVEAQENYESPSVCHFAEETPQDLEQSDREISSLVHSDQGLESGLDKIEAEEMVAVSVSLVENNTIDSECNVPQEEPVDCENISVAKKGGLLGVNMGSSPSIDSNIITDSSFSGLEIDANAKDSASFSKDVEKSHLSYAQILAHGLAPIPSVPASSEPMYLNEKTSVLTHDHPSTLSSKQHISLGEINVTPLLDPSVPISSIKTNNYREDDKINLDTYCTQPTKPSESVVITPLSVSHSGSETIYNNDNKVFSSLSPYEVGASSLAALDIEKECQSSSGKHSQSTTDLDSQQNAETPLEESKKVKERKGKRQSQKAHLKAISKSENRDEKKGTHDTVLKAQVDESLSSSTKVLENISLNSGQLKAKNEGKNLQAIDEEKSTQKKRHKKKKVSAKGEGIEIEKGLEATGCVEAATEAMAKLSEVAAPGTDIQTGLAESINAALVAEVEVSRNLLPGEAAIEGSSDHLRPSHPKSSKKKRGKKGEKNSGVELTRDNTETIAQDVASSADILSEKSDGEVGNCTTENASKACVEPDAGAEGLHPADSVTAGSQEGAPQAKSKRKRGSHKKSLKKEANEHGGKDLCEGLHARVNGNAECKVDDAAVDISAHDTIIHESQDEKSKPTATAKGRRKKKPKHASETTDEITAAGAGSESKESDEKGNFTSSSIKDNAMESSGAPGGELREQIPLSSMIATEKIGHKTSDDIIKDGLGFESSQSLGDRITEETAQYVEDEKYLPDIEREPFIPELHHSKDSVVTEVLANINLDLAPLPSESPKEVPFQGKTDHQHISASIVSEEISPEGMAMNEHEIFTKTENIFVSDSKLGDLDENYLDNDESPSSPTKVNRKKNHNNAKLRGKAPTKPEILTLDTISSVENGSLKQPEITVGSVDVHYSENAHEDVKKISTSLKDAPKERTTKIDSHMQSEVIDISKKKKRGKSHHGKLKDDKSGAEILLSVEESPLKPMSTEVTQVKAHEKIESTPSEKESLPAGGKQVEISPQNQASANEKTDGKKKRKPKPQKDASKPKHESPQRDPIKVDVVEQAKDDPFEIIHSPLSLNKEETFESPLTEDVSLSPSMIIPEAKIMMDQIAESSALKEIGKKKRRHRSHKGDTARTQPEISTDVHAKVDSDSVEVSLPLKIEQDVASPENVIFSEPSLGVTHLSGSELPSADDNIEKVSKEESAVAASDAKGESKKKRRRQKSSKSLTPLEASMVNSNEPLCGMEVSLEAPLLKEMTLLVSEVAVEHKKEELLASPQSELTTADEYAKEIPPSKGMHAEFEVHSPQHTPFDDRGSKNMPDAKSDDALSQKDIPSKLKTVGIGEASKKKKHQKSGGVAANLEEKVSESSATKLVVNATELAIEEISRDVVESITEIESNAQSELMKENISSVNQKETDVKESFESKPSGLGVGDSPKKKRRHRSKKSSGKPDSDFVGTSDPLTDVPVDVTKAEESEKILASHTAISSNDVMEISEETAVENVHNKNIGQESIGNMDSSRKCLEGLEPSKDEGLSVAKKARTPSGEIYGDGVSVKEIQVLAKKDKDQKEDLTPEGSADPVSSDDTEKSKKKGKGKFPKGHDRKAPGASDSVLISEEVLVLRPDGVGEQNREKAKVASYEGVDHVKDEELLNLAVGSTTESMQEGTSMKESLAEKVIQSAKSQTDGLCDQGSASKLLSAVDAADVQDSGEPVFKKEEIVSSKPSLPQVNQEAEVSEWLTSEVSKYDLTILADSEKMWYETVSQVSTNLAVGSNSVSKVAVEIPTHCDIEIMTSGNELHLPDAEDSKLGVKESSVSDEKACQSMPESIPGNNVCQRKMSAPLVGDRLEKDSKSVDRFPSKAPETQNLSTNLLPLLNLSRENVWLDLSAYAEAESNWNFLCFRNDTKSLSQVSEKPCDNVIDSKAASPSSNVTVSDDLKSSEQKSMESNEKPDSGAMHLLPSKNAGETDSSKCSTSSHDAQLHISMPLVGELHVYNIHDLESAERKFYESNYNDESSFEYLIHSTTNDDKLEKNISREMALKNESEAESLSEAWMCSGKPRLAVKGITNIVSHGGPSPILEPKVTHTTLPMETVDPSSASISSVNVYDIAQLQAAEKDFYESMSSLSNLGEKFLSHQIKQEKESFHDSSSEIKSWKEADSVFSLGIEKSEILSEGGVNDSTEDSVVLGRLEGELLMGSEMTLESSESVGEGYPLSAPDIPTQVPSKDNVLNQVEEGTLSILKDVEDIVQRSNELVSKMIRTTEFIDTTCSSRLPLGNQENELQKEVSSLEGRNLQKNLPLDSFWTNKWIVDDAEALWQKLLAHHLAAQTMIVDDISPRKDDDRDDNGDDGRGGGSNDPRGRDNAQNMSASSPTSGSGSTLQLYADLPGGLGSWRDDSTYLSSSNEAVEYPLDGLQDAEKLIQVVQVGFEESPKKSLPRRDLDDLDRIKASVMVEIGHLDQFALDMEAKFTSMPTNDLEPMEETLADLRKLLEAREVEVSRLEGVLASLPQDVEVQELNATLARTKGHLTILLSQVKIALAAVKNAVTIRDERLKEIKEYQNFLTELDLWLQNTKSAVAAGVTGSQPRNLKDQIESYQKLLLQLSQHEDQIRDMSVQCENLQKIQGVEKFAGELCLQLSPLKSAIVEIRDLINVRLDHLQDALVGEKPKSPPSDPPLPEENKRTTVETLENVPSPHSPDIIDEGFIVIPSPLPADVMKSLDAGSEAIVVPSSEVDLPNVDITPSPVVAPGPLSTDLQEKIDEVVEREVLVETGSLEQMRDHGEYSVQELTSSLHPHQLESIPGQELVSEPTEAIVEMIEVSQSKAKGEEPKLTTQVTERDCQTSPVLESLKDNIQIIKKVTGEEETIEISTTPGYIGETQVTSPSSEVDDIVVEMSYDDDKSKEPNAVSVSELSITHTTPHSFETIVSDPAETTTKVIVDEDGTKRIIVRQLRKTMTTRHQQQMATIQRLTTVSSDSGNQEPETSNAMAFSEVVLQGQKTTTSDNTDGQTVSATTQSYSGRVMGGVPGNIHVTEFTSGPQETVTYHTGDAIPSNVLIRGQELSRGGDFLPSPAGIVSDQGVVENVSEQLQMTEDGEAPEYHMTTSSVKAVVEQVTRRVVRRSRKIIRKIMIIDGKEHVSEEIIELPEEVEVSEAGVPVVKIEMSHTESSNHGEGSPKIIPSDTIKSQQISSVNIPGSETILEPEITVKAPAVVDALVCHSQVGGDSVVPNLKSIQSKSGITLDKSQAPTTSASPSDINDGSRIPQKEAAEDTWYSGQETQFVSSTSMTGERDGNVESLAAISVKPSEEIAIDEAISLKTPPCDGYEIVGDVHLMTSSPSGMVHGVANFPEKIREEQAFPEKEIGFPKSDDLTSEIRVLPSVSYKEVKVIEIQPSGLSITQDQDTVEDLPQDDTQQEKDIDVVKVQEIPGEKYELVRVVEVISPVTSEEIKAKLIISGEATVKELPDPETMHREDTPTQEGTPMAENVQIQQIPQEEMESFIVKTSCITEPLEKDFVATGGDEIEVAGLDSETPAETDKVSVEKYRLVRVVEINQPRPSECKEMSESTPVPKSCEGKEDEVSSVEYSVLNSSKVDFPEEENKRLDEVFSGERKSPKLEVADSCDEISHTISVDPMYRVKIDIMSSTSAEPKIVGDEKLSMDASPGMTASIKQESEQRYISSIPCDTAPEFTTTKNEVNIELPPTVTISEVRTVHEVADSHKPSFKQDKKEEDAGIAEPGSSTAVTKKKKHKRGKHKDSTSSELEKNDRSLISPSEKEKDISALSPVETAISCEAEEQPSLVIDTKLKEQASIPSEVVDLGEEVKVVSADIDEEDKSEESKEATEKSHDTGYDAEDKTFSEQHLPGDDTRKKRKKKKRRKLRDESETPEVYPLSPKDDSDKYSDLSSSIPCTESVATAPESNSESLEIECTPSHGSRTHIESPQEEAISDLAVSLDDTTVSESLESQEVPYDPKEVAHPSRESKKKKGPRSKKSKESSKSISQVSPASDISTTVKSSPPMHELPLKSAEFEDAVQSEEPVHGELMSELREAERGKPVSHEIRTIQETKEMGVSDDSVEVGKLKPIGRIVEQTEESSQLSSLDEPMEITIQTVVSFVSPESSEKVTDDEVQQKPSASVLEGETSHIRVSTPAKQSPVSTADGTKHKKESKKKKKHLPKKVPHGSDDSKEHSSIGADQDTTTVVQTLEFDVPCGMMDPYAFSQVHVIDNSNPEVRRETVETTTSSIPMTDQRPDVTSSTPNERHVSFMELPVGKESRDEKMIDKVSPHSQGFIRGGSPSASQASVTQANDNIEFTLSAFDDVPSSQDGAVTSDDHIVSSQWSTHHPRRFSREIVSVESVNAHIPLADVESQTSGIIRQTKDMSHPKDEMNFNLDQSQLSSSHKSGEIKPFHEDTTLAKTIKKDGRNEDYPDSKVDSKSAHPDEEASFLATHSQTQVVKASSLSEDIPVVLPKPSPVKPASPTKEREFTLSVLNPTELIAPPSQEKEIPFAADVPTHPEKETHTISSTVTYTGAVSSADICESFQEHPIKGKQSGTDKTEEIYVASEDPMEKDIVTGPEGRDAPRRSRGRSQKSQEDYSDGSSQSNVPTNFEPKSSGKRKGKDKKVKFSRPQEDFPKISVQKVASSLAEPSPVSSSPGDYQKEVSSLPGALLYSQVVKINSREPSPVRDMGTGAANPPQEITLTSPGEIVLPSQRVESTSFPYEISETVSMSTTYPEEHLDSMPVNVKTSFITKESRTVSPWEKFDKETPKPKEMAVEPLDHSGTLSVEPISEVTSKLHVNASALAERLNNLQNTRNPSQMSGLIYFATHSHSVPSDSLQVQQQLSENMEGLDDAIKNRNTVIIESTYITTIEVISYWLEIIEHRIYSVRQVGDIKVQENELLSIDEEMAKVGKNLGVLENNLGTVSQICNEDTVLQIQNCLSSLKEQAKNVSDTAKEDEDTTKYGIQQWEEFQNCINSLSLLIEESRKQLQDLGCSDSPAHAKLQELENLDAINQGHRHELKRLLSIGSKLAMEFPGGEFPQECGRAFEAVKSIEHGILKEKEKILQLLSLTDEYKQTLDEFAQIIEVADSLVEGTINVNGLHHLQEEMQKHRKFFANLSHCRQILESLEGNLDPETRRNHAELHSELHGRAAGTLDKAAGRAQQMALAASRWTVLEQGAKEEEGWVRVAHQRMPDLANVTTSDFNQYISLYQALSSDIVIHHARVMQLMNIANKLQEIITCSGLEATYSEFAEVIIRLQDNVSSNLHKLLVFKEAWAHFNMLSTKLENWVNAAEINLANITTPDLLPLNVREFWELKAQFEVYNYIHKEANRSFCQAIAILPIADKVRQKEEHEKLEERWRCISSKIDAVQTNLRNSITQDIPANEKLIILERELRELKLAMEDMNGIIKTEEDLNLYVERIQVLCTQVEGLEEELGCLGFLPASESEHVGSLLGSARRLGLQLREELEAGIHLREKLQTLQKGMAKVKKSHERAEGILQQCGEAQTLGSEVVEQALNNCQALQEELHLQWQDLVALRQLLHSLPHRLMFTSVSPVRLERDISALQDSHQALEQQCSHLLLSLRSRLTMWRNFENALELVHRHVDEADYMMELLTVKGSLDYEHLCTATQRLEDLAGSLEVKEKGLLTDLRSAAAPLARSCSPEARRRVEEAVQEAIAAWNETCESVGQLCERYQSAVRLWQQYREASEAVKQWAEQQASLLQEPPPDNSLVEVCEKNLAEQRDRLGELRGLVAQIASDVGLEGGVVLQGEVEALGHRLEDVRESLATLAQVAESRAACSAGSAAPFAADLQSTHDFLSSVQQSLSAMEESNMKDSENQLNTLRNHLLSLGKSEGHIQNLKEKAVEVSCTNPESSVSIVDILQLWQQVFRETFQQYHRLSASLVKSQDGAAALQLWQEYLLHVQSFLSESIPADYHSLTEQQHLCEVHQNLLTAQQSILLSKSEDKVDGGDVISKKAATNSLVMEQFNSLTNLHNETLARIMERHGKVRTRMTGWERYRCDQDGLLRWLKDMEHEKQKLQLRYIHVRSLPLTINKIQVLLDQIPEGESQASNLHAQQMQLLEFCEESLATSIRIEHAAIVQRINNLQASLETWKDFLNRVSSLQLNYEEKSGRVQAVLRDIHSKAISQKPLSHHEMQATLQNLHMLQGELATLVGDLQELVGTQEQLKDCVSPTDMKGISQKSWLLWQQHGDLEHQLALLSHQIEEKLGMHKLFDSRYARFIVWVKDMEERLTSGRGGRGNERAEDLIAQLEGDEGGELALRGKERTWLVETGDKLLEMYEDDKYKEEVRDKIKLVQDSWALLSQLRKTRILKLQELVRMLSMLEEQQLDMRTRLHQMETRLMSPLAFIECSETEVESMLKNHEELQAEIDGEEEKINKFVNLCDNLMVESEITDALVDVDYVQHTRDDIMKRWKNILAMSSTRKRKIKNVWTLLVDMLKLCNEHEEWFLSQELTIEEITENGPSLTKENILHDIDRVEGVLTELDSKGPALQIMEQSYSKLAKEAGFKLIEDIPDVAVESEVVEQKAALPLHQARTLLMRWNLLPKKAFDLAQSLRYLLNLYTEFSNAHRRVIVGLTQTDLQLTNLEHLSDTIGNYENVMKLESEVEAYTPLLQSVDNQGQALMDRSRHGKTVAIQSMMEEYWILWKEIERRLRDLKASIPPTPESKIEAKRQEVDESVQVDTLRFEQESAIQVDTLGLASFHSSGQITSREAYLMELETAISECTFNLESLQASVQSQTPQGDDMTAASNALVKVIGLCHSSVELVKHLSELLLRECGVSEEEARTAQVHNLCVQYEALMALAKAREQHLRSMGLWNADSYMFICEHDRTRLTCPLCSKKNWQQLDNDLWRLEKWLEFAEGTLSALDPVPTNIELLEDAIQDHREFLMNLDSHNNIVVSLNIVGKHLADHTEDTSKANELRSRLEATNKRWECVCQAAGRWQTKLQTALMENHEFHQTIDELVNWLEKTENSIRQTEPVDLTEDLNIIEDKYNRFKELLADLEKCEPRVLSLQEAADHLLKQSPAQSSAELPPEASGRHTAWERLTNLRLRLQSLRRICRVYVLKLGAVLGRDPSELGIAGVSTLGAQGLSRLSQELLDQAPGRTQLQGTIPPEQQHTNGPGGEEDEDRTILSRSYRFLGRVLRASLPIQAALMLLLVGVASLVPNAEEDYSCALANNFARSFEPMLTYPDGPPPV
ncbi:uncharacterized protein LOC124158024 [Ischnura elegans]|uniref:uncharacterized protein LOC124158024 n=1 Tax=Ischnura elegans TaxID=197161 RepID=UPI001ED87727|nr:uncharacterized protein LOC124158024 [Ischnura elegans]